MRVRQASYHDRPGEFKGAYRAAMAAIATVGVYESDLEHFLAALRAHDVRQVLDVRQRRGVRGREYAWANAARLQAALEDAGIEYRHHKELAPTTELRRLQYAEDDRQGVGKRSRRALAPAYAERYTREILDAADLGPVAAALPEEGCTALLCVERDPEACHRSLLAARLAGELGLEVVHIRPCSCEAEGMKGAQKPKKLAKKAPQKTLKEQRAAKAAKKSSRG
jgi:uncharacterized protein (DUF488 family)